MPGPRHGGERGGSGGGGGVDLGLGAAHVESSIAPEGLDVDEEDAGGFFSLVGGEDDAARGVGFEDEEGLAGQDHVALAVPVDELTLVGFDGADDLVGDDLGFEAVFFSEFERVEDGAAGLADLSLVVVVDFKEPEGALDDLNSGDDVRGLEGEVGDAVDGDTGCDLDPEAGHIRDGEEAAGGLPHEAGQLWLYLVEEDVAAKLQGDLRRCDKRRQALFTGRNLPLTASRSKHHLRRLLHLLWRRPGACVCMSQGFAR